MTTTARQGTDSTGAEPAGTAQHVPTGLTDQRPDAAGRAGADGVAARLAGLVEPLFGGDLPLRLRAWDGSVYGPADAPTVVVRDAAALRRLVFHPGELGLAQAYVTGEIDVEGDLLDGFRRVWKRARALSAGTSEGVGRTGLGGAAGVTAGVSATARRLPLLLDGVRAARDLGAVGLPPAPPSSQARLRGRLHTLTRDRDAISHHYDLSNEFYSLILDPTMAYSCGYWTSDEPDYTVGDAQRDKLDLVCRKLGIEPGGRHLDIGCGWGSLSLWAAEHYGASVVGVTISAEQKAFIDERVRERGLQDRVEIRLQDYRDVPDGPFDTISSIEMGEHVGQANYPTYARGIHDLLRPGGRALVQQMSRTTRPGGGPFIEAFIAPDMHMRPVGETVAMFERAGLEMRDVHGMREHYVRTVNAWYDTFESNWPRVLDLVGEEVGRVWRLYLVGGALAFEEGRMGVDQMLMVRPTRDGRSGMPSVRAW
ncbi:cyclopropane-fatty-acyl-phospholipid synthase [Terracoccus luteus]|uniref:Cyclopropane-fatty-acyl-phospholipid synthase n=1 Tax=Terracoccus luteus TaxID=53356 RepID=A0A495XRH1_9MICO|nr:cyclopropane-fatty-acyl-phospholipid synthase family protein [Terracoccus luteus]RKT77100.1 cyclopropane-fatty-acyl-phospholipid synthase [Terracoccus luteus]